MSKKRKVLILGAGPSGLTVALALIEAGYSLDDILVIEKENVVGGLCRSEIVDCAPIDIGGGHFLDVKRKEVLQFLFRFMAIEEWNVYQRVAKIRICGFEVDQPLEANLWQLPTDVEVDFLESIAKAGCVQGQAMPESFEEWIKWKLGERIARKYMLPYNRKIWCTELSKLGTYWLYKLPNVSFRETLLSCLERKPMGALPAHGTFLYPKRFGYGELWRRMGERLGDSLVTNCAVEHVDLTSHTVNGRWRGQTIISTIPWTLWPGYCLLPKEILTAIESLKSAAINVDYHPNTLIGPAHWIYEPDEAISYHRKLLRCNFISGARGHWTETNATRSSSTNGVRFHNEFAYPINTLGKPEAVKKILAWGCSKDVIGLGRWGRWEHMNSDVAVEEALRLAGELKGRIVA